MARRRPELVGLGYKAGVGKDTAAGALVWDGWIRVAFADNVRALAEQLDPDIVTPTGAYPLSLILRSLSWDEAKKIEPVRRLLQRLGVGAREILGSDVWVRSAMRTVDGLLRRGERVVITDVRFENEAEAIRRRGGLVVRVDRAAAPQLDHVSETALDGYEHWSAVLTNDEHIEDLHDQIRILVTA